MNQYNLQFILIEVVFCMVDVIYLIFSSDVLHAVCIFLFNFTSRHRLACPFSITNIQINHSNTVSLIRELFFIPLQIIKILTQTFFSQTYTEIVCISIKNKYFSKHSISGNVHTNRNNLIVLHVTCCKLLPGFFKDCKKSTKMLKTGGNL